MCPKRALDKGLEVLTNAGGADVLGELLAEGLAERDVAFLEDALEEPQGISEDCS